MKNERTSPRVARIAAKVLARRYLKATGRIYVDCWIAGCSAGPHSTQLTWSDIRALAASCLTQAADKPKPAATRRKPKRGRG